VMKIMEKPPPEQTCQIKVHKSAQTLQRGKANQQYCGSLYLIIGSVSTSVAVIGQWGSLQADLGLIASFPSEEILGQQQQLSAIA